MGEYNIYKDLFLYLPPKSLKLALLGDKDDEAKEALRQELLTVPGVGEARAYAMAGKAGNNALIAWPFLAKCWLENPDDCLKEQARKRKFLNAASAKHLRSLNTSTFFVPAQWSTSAVRSLREWILDYLPESAAILEKHLLEKGITDIDFDTYTSNPIPTADVDQ